MTPRNAIQLRLDTNGPNYSRKYESFLTLPAYFASEQMVKRVQSFDIRRSLATVAIANRYNSRKMTCARPISTFAFSPRFVSPVTTLSIPSAIQPSSWDAFNAKQFSRFLFPTRRERRRTDTFVRQKLESIK